LAKPLNTLNLEHTIKNTINDNLMRRLGQLAVDMVRQRTRLGYGVESFGGPQQKLKPLAPRTVDNRRKKQLHGDTSPRKSNLTATGELLDSIDFRISGGKIEVFITGPRNQKITEYVSEERPFFALTKPQVSRLADLIEEAIRNYLIKGS
jgi:hypothetical protein